MNALGGLITSTLSTGGIVAVCCQRNAGPYVERVRGRACPRALRLTDMTKRFLCNAFLGLLAVSLAGCALQVRSDVNRTAFHPGQCHTFAFSGSFRTDNPMHNTV